MCYKHALRICLQAALFVALASNQQLYGDIFSESRSLVSRMQSQHLASQHICQREVPAIFYQTLEDEPIRGNGSTIFYHRIEVCCEGYTRSFYNWNECVPDCVRTSPDNCKNGFCSAPEECICFDEFVKNERGACIQTCPISCQHGRCYLNGTCACNPGYTLDPETRKFCRPKCEQACGTNQACVAPNQCACEPGYTMITELGCQPNCTPDCGLGKCVGPNQCECFSGYTKRPQRNVCEAECYINCENGFCESRFRCLCRAGYKYDYKTTSCLPDCGDDCQHGVCVAPGVCKCFEGYVHKENTCVPACQGGCGRFGICLAPNICGCGSAKQHCILGDCDAHGHCICRDGHTHFMDRCVAPEILNTLITSYDQREHYNQQLKYEFNGLIGRLFDLTT